LTWPIRGEDGKRGCQLLKDGEAVCKNLCTSEVDRIILAFTVRKLKMQKTKNEDGHYEGRTHDLGIISTLAPCD
jgi:hypothetical protein